MTAADLDIPAVLITSYFKTGTEEYLYQAHTIAYAIWDYEINQSTYLIYSGGDPCASPGTLHSWYVGNEAYPDLEGLRLGKAVFRGMVRYRSWSKFHLARKLRRKPRRRLLNDGQRISYDEDILHMLYSQLLNGKFVKLH